MLEKEELSFPNNQKESLQTLMRLNYFLELKDPYTKKHCENVSKYAVILAKELNLSNSKIEIIKIGAKLHDIGKIGIPDSILMKKTFLSKQEFEIMKKHPLIGDTIIPNNENYKLIKQMIRSHHERIDGTGYPDGLQGDEIPYYAKILSIADCFDAMTTNRGYNNPKTLEEAINELREASYPKFNNRKFLNQQLDSILVEKFIQALNNNKDIIDEFLKKDLEIINLRKNKNIKRNYKN